MKAKAISARFEGPCAACPDYISLGEMITATESGGWKHEDCEEQPMLGGGKQDAHDPALFIDPMSPEEARAKMCGRCFTVHAPGQEECW